MDVVHCLVVRHQTVLVDDGTGEGFRQGVGYEGEEVTDEFRYCRRSKETAFHLVGSVVVGAERITFYLRYVGIVLNGLNLGMVYLQASVEYGWFAKDKICGAHLICLTHETKSLKPYEFDKAGSIGETTYDTSVPSFTYRLHRDYLSYELHVGHVAVNLRDAIYLATIDITVREVVEHVAHSLDANLLFKEFGSLWTYATKEFYVVGGIEHGYVLFYEYAVAKSFCEFALYMTQFDILFHGIGTKQGVVHLCLTCFQFFVDDEELIIE